MIYHAVVIDTRALISGSASVASREAKKLRYMREYAPENQATHSF